MRDPVSQTSPGWTRFGLYVRAVRLESGLSQCEVAAALNAVTRRPRPYLQGEVSAYEHGDRLTPEVVRDFAVALRLDRYVVAEVLLGADFPRPAFVIEANPQNGRVDF